MRDLLESLRRVARDSAHDFPRRSYLDQQEALDVLQLEQNSISLNVLQGGVRDVFLKTSSHFRVLLQNVPRVCVERDVVERDRIELCDFVGESFGELFFEI